MKTTEISVVLSVRNEEKYIESALASILRQADVEFEIVVIDDNSTDSTFKIVSTMAIDEPRIKLLKNPGIGKCSAFNYGLAIAKGEFLCIFAGDDIMPKNSLRERFNKVKNSPKNLPCIGLSKLVTFSEIKKFHGHLNPKKPGKGSLSGSSPLMNRVAYEMIFPVPESLPNEDTWMELAISHLPGLNIIHSNVIACEWRCHQGNSINMMGTFKEYNSKYSARMKAIQMFYEKHAGYLEKKSLNELKGKIVCENYRGAGNVMGVLFSPVKLVTKLRALSTTNSFFYGIRTRFFGIFSGR